MNPPARSLTFAWWNLHDFAHFDAARDTERRWPKRLEDYEAKRDRVLAAFGELFGAGFPDLLAVCEITRDAARDLLARMPAGYALHAAPEYENEDKFQVAVFYRSATGLQPEPVLIPSDKEDVAEGTRPMVPVHLVLPGHLIRFVACHWTALDLPSSRLVRERLADVLRRDIHAFFYPEEQVSDLVIHAVVLGDLNEEPMAQVFEHRLIGKRDHESSRITHWRDEQVRRVRLYNAAWRYLGEQAAHGAQPPSVIGAGTCFHDDYGWRTLDHVLVTGGLLGPAPPYFDEANTKVASTPIMRDERGLPRPFVPGAPRGVSDHLPLVGRLILPESSP